MSRRLDPELPRRCGVSDPMIEDTVRNQFLPRYPNAFAIERSRAQAAKAERIVNDRDTGREHGRAELLAKEARLSSDRRACDRAGKMAEQRRGDSRIENDRIFPGLRPRRIEPCDGALACPPANLRGAFDVRKVARAVPRVIALHRTSLARDDARGVTVAARAVGAREAICCRQSDDCTRGAGAGSP